MPATSHAGAERTVEEEVELLELAPPSREVSSYETDGRSLTRSQAWNLYTSHLLSTWNARTYEFAAIIFTAAAYPDTLVASAIRGIITTTASICFSASLGRWIDHAPNRLNTLLKTITANRGSVIIACAVWFFIVSNGGTDLHERTLYVDAFGLDPLSGILKDALFAAVLVLGVFEKLSGAANMTSMERDWVVTVANPNGQAYDLTRLNSVMRRIDLICKLVAPIIISIIISSTGSVKIGVLIVGGMSAVSWAAEWLCASRVWNNNPSLQRPKIIPHAVGNSEDGPDLPTLTRIRSRGQGLIEKSMQWFWRYLQDFRGYFSSPVWIPSLALSLLHLSALSYSATFITYLLSAGFSLNLITIARAVGSVVEISSTVVTPVGVSYLGKAHHHYQLPQSNEVDEEEAETSLLENASSQHGSTEIGLERLGLWGITWQLVNLIPVVLALWALSPTASTPPTPVPLLPHSLPSRLLQTTSTLITLPTLLPLTLFTFLSLSRLGLWIFDLTTQQLTQTLVLSTSRSSFAGVETSFVAFFELTQNIATIILSRPDQFRWLAIGSLGAVAMSAGAYAGWVRAQRGHLVHWGILSRSCDLMRKRSGGLGRRVGDSLSFRGVGVGAER